MTLTSPTINTPTITNPTVSTGTFTSPVIATSLDLNGAELILDADADTSITADTDDQIDIKISAADDFQFTANTFTALSGSTIKTDTIAETTAGNGIAVDGLTIKDSMLYFDVQATTPTTPSATEAILYIANGSADADNQPVLLTDNGIRNYFEFNDSLFRQALINGGMDVWQRNTSATPNDDVYMGADRWNFLTETNGSWTVARDTDVPSGIGFKYSAKFTNVTQNNQCAIVQILENVDAVKFQDKVVTLSFYAKTTGTEISNLRAQVLSWTGTADTVTSDVIGTWNSDGTDIELPVNWTAENVGSNLALTASWQRFSIPNISVNTASITNLAVIIWVDDGTIAANDDFWITGVQLNVGDIALPYMPKSFEEELIKCQRFYEKSYDYATAPSTNTAVGTMGGVAATTSYVPGIGFKVRKRTIPTVTIISQVGTSAKATVAGGGDAGTTVTTGTPSEVGYLTVSDSGTGFTAGALVYWHFVASAEL